MIETALGCKVVEGTEKLAAGEFPEAARLCDVPGPTSRIIDSDVLNAALLCHARALKGMGVRQEALRAYQKAVWFDPFNPDIRDELTKVGVSDDNSAEVERWMAAELRATLLHAPQLN